MLLCTCAYLHARCSTVCNSLTAAWHRKISSATHTVQHLCTCAHVVQRVLLLANTASVLCVRRQDQQQTAILYSILCCGVVHRPVCVANGQTTAWRRRQNNQCGSLSYVQVSQLSTTLAWDCCSAHTTLPGCNASQATSTAMVHEIVHANGR